MSEQLDNLEREVEAALAAVSDKLTVVPSEAVVLRVKDAVRHALDEDWLAEQTGPAPSADAIARTQSAIRDELRQQRVRASAAGAWARGGAAVAAAAMILLAVGVIWRVGMTGPAVVESSDDADLALLVAAADSVLTDDPATASILDELAAIEADIAGWAPTTEADADNLYDLVDEIDALLAEPMPDDNTSRRNDAQRGAFG